MPPPIEESVAYLEGKVEDHSRGFGEIRDQVTNVDGHVLALDQKVDGFRTELASRIDGVGVRVDTLDQKIDRFREELASRIDAVDQRIGSVDQKFDRFREELASRIDAVDRKVSRQFVWLVGIQVALLLSVIGALLQG